MVLYNERMNEEGKSRVEGLKENLYSRTKYHEPTDERRPVSVGEVVDVEEKWDSPNLDEILTHDRRKPETTFFMKKVFLAALVFFLSALALAVYAFFGGANFVSSKNVDIKILGPVSVSAGDVLELSIVVSNKNNADLESANLSVLYPQGTRNADDPSQSMTYQREELGAIKAGREATYNAKGILFGEREEVKEIKVTVDYKIKGSNATFTKEKVYEIGIGESPISLSVEQPPSITSGENFATTITLTHNNAEVLRNVVLRGEYPYGYTITGSSPQPSGQNNLWVIGDMAPGSKRTVTIQGKLVGENEEQRSFRFYAGVSEDADFTSLGTTLYSAIQTVSISRPSVALNIELNGNSGSSYIAPVGRSVDATIGFQNNLPERLINPKLEVKITGPALDKQSVQALGGGFYDSRTNKIVWNLEDVLAEKVFSAGTSGQVSFGFSSLDSLPSGLSNPEILLEAVLTGTSFAESQRLVTVTDKQSVKISSQVSLSSKSLHSTGGFTNTGPIPPKVETETKYTVVLNVGNTQNDIVGAKVTAALGPNVKWTGSATNGVSFNESNNTVTWNIGTLSSGTGFSSSQLQGAFQVALTPSLSQVGSSPTLVSGITFTGKDSFTGEVMTVTNSPVTTNISSDPKFVQGDERVVR